MKAHEYIEVMAVGVLLAVVLKLFVVDAVMISSRSMEATLLPGDVVIVNKLGYAMHSLFGAGSRSDYSSFLPFENTMARGDIIIFRFPASLQTPRMHNNYFVKRCIGLPGDEVAVRDRKVLVNGRRLTGPWSLRTSANVSFGPVCVPKKGDVIDFGKQDIRRWISLLEGEGHTVSIGMDGTPVIDGIPVKEYQIRNDYVFVLGDNLGNSYDGREWGFLAVQNIVGEAIFVPWSVEVDPGTNASSGIPSIRWDRIGTLVH